MFAVVITEKGGAQRRVDFDKSEVTIGRVQGNDIILPKGNVSKRHSRIVLKDNRFIVVDLKSTNGTYVNGRKITSPLVVKSGDKIYIGDFILTVEEPGGAAAAPSPPAAAGPPMGAPPPAMGPPVGMGPPPLGGPAMGPPPMAAPPPMGPPPLAAPPPAGPPPLAAPPPMAAPPPAGMAHPTMAHGGMGAPPMPSPDLGRPPSMRPPPPGMPARASAPGLGAPPPLPARAPDPVEPPAMPPGGERYNLDEDPADETMAPSPRVVARQPERPRMDPPRAEPPRAEPPRAEAPRAEPPRAEAPRAEPPHREPTPAAPAARTPEPARAEAPIRLPEPPTAPAPRAIEPGSLGPFEAMLEEPGVLEIVCDGPARVSVDRGTGLVGANVKFASDAALSGAVARLFSMAGATVPRDLGGVHEATMPDGTHVLAVLPPTVVGGPYVEVRRLGRPAVPGESLVSQGVLSADMLQTLRSAVAVRRNIIVLGPSDAGVSALVSVLAAAIHADERIATIEASPEIALPAGRAIRLVGAAGGLGALLSRASAIRVDRLIIDGAHGPDLRAAMVLLATRSGGGILGVRAYAPGPTLAQLEALAALGGGTDGLAALVGSVAHVVVRMGRGADGVRRVESISEIGDAGLVELFEHGDGGFASTGTRPTFLG